MKTERVYYYSSNRFETLVKELLRTLKISNKSRLFDGLIKGKEFVLKRDDVILFSRLFPSLEAQVHDIDSRFISRTPQNQLDTSNPYSEYEFQTSQELISHIHIVDIELVSNDEKSNLRFTETGDFGVTIYSPHFCECYLRILQETIVVFDTEISIANKVELDESSKFFHKINKFIDSLNDHNSAQRGLKASGLKRRNMSLFTSKEFERKSNEFKELTTEELEAFNNNNNEIIFALMKASSELDNVTKGKKTAIYFRNQIAKLIIEASDTSSITTRTDVDFMMSLIKDMKVVHYKVNAESKKYISHFKKNMDDLNVAIKNYHELAKSEKATSEELYKRAEIVKRQLRRTAMNNFNLIKEFNSNTSDK